MRQPPLLAIGALTVFVTCGSASPASSSAPDTPMTGGSLPACSTWAAQQRGSGVPPAKDSVAGQRQSFYDAGGGIRAVNAKYYGAWFPASFGSAGPSRVMVSLHGTGGAPETEWAIDWSSQMQSRGWGFLGLKYVDDATGIHDDDATIYANIKAMIDDLRASCAFGSPAIYLVGFSRGSAESFPVTYRDLKDRHFFTATGNNSGAWFVDQPLPPTLAGIVSRQETTAFAGAKFWMYCGEMDQQSGSPMCDHMENAKTFVPQYGGTVLTLYRDPTGGHGGLAKNADAVSKMFAAFELEAVATPTMSLDWTALVFGAVSDGVRLTSQTSPQTVRLTQSGAGTVSWTAGSSSPWLEVSPTSGSGSATLTVAVRFAAGLAATQNGTIALTFTGASSTSATITATLNVATGLVAPVGSFDTPADGSTVAGSIAVTGWALDNIEVTRVQIQRDAHPSDPPGAVVNGRIFVGDASFVEGARPDVQTGNPSMPLNSRGGWGYLMLTRGLIWDGKGPFKLYALATDKEGNTVTLGSKTITVNNAAATKPFGAIDAPAPGAIVSGVFPTTGWVLTPNAGATIPATGVQVTIDGTYLTGVPSVSDRADIANGFPTFNTAGAGRGLFVDSTQYANGTHVLGWVVTDSAGQADGVGSRFLTVSNGSLIASATSQAALSRHLDVDALPYPGDGGRRILKVEELDRIEVRLDEDAGSSYQGYVRMGDRLAALPIGSRLEGPTFTWQLAAGFLGRYDLVFVRERGAVPVARQDVRITVHPQGTFSRPQIVLDTPARDLLLDAPFRLTGWALDPSTPHSTGISTVHVWAYAVRGGAPTFVGSATPAGRRPDVGAVYGERFQDSGFELPVSGLGPGVYDLAVFAWSDGAGAFLPARVIRITVR